MSNEQEKSNLKDWADVDPKYKWRAFDEEGDRFYFVLKPQPCWQIGIWLNDLQDVELCFDGGSTGVTQSKWQDTLEQRPPNV